MGDEFYCDECGSGDDGSTESKIRLELEDAMAAAVAASIPAHVRRLESENDGLRSETSGLTKELAKLKSQKGSASVHLLEGTLLKLGKVKEGLADVQEKMATLTHQRNVLYTFVSNCVGEWDMTRDVRNLVIELRRNKI